MAKFNIEVELDFLEEDYSIDEEIKEAVVRGVKNELLRKSIDDVTKKLEGAIAEKLEEATKTIDEHIENFVATVTEKQIEKIKMPHRASSWSNEVKFIPISEYIGMQYEAYLTKKIYDEHFNIAKYSYDEKYSMAEAQIRKYLNQTLSKQVSEMVRKAQADAENTVLKTLEQTLKDQLAVDTIKRMNIPKLLESLQMKALEFENEGKEGLNHD